MAKATPHRDRLLAGLPQDWSTAPVERVAAPLLQILCAEERAGSSPFLAPAALVDELYVDRQAPFYPERNHTLLYVVAEAYACLLSRGLTALSPFAREQNAYFVTRLGYVVAASLDPASDIASLALRLRGPGSDRGA